jgi:hypothetical protein
MTHEIDEKRRDDLAPASKTGVSVNRRAFMNSLVALPIAAAVPTTAPAMPIDDPIFAALEAYRQAESACDAFAAAHNDIPDEAGDRLAVAYRAVLRTRPTTPAGLMALTGWAREDACEMLDHSLMPGESLCDLTATIDDAVRGMAGLQPWSPAVPAEADSELIQLGEKFALLSEQYDQAQEAERPRNEAFEREYDLLSRKHAPNRIPKDERSAFRHSWNERFPRPSPSVDDIDELIIPLGEKINAMPAHTLEGFKAKALLVHHWPTIDLSSTDESFWPEKVLRDLLYDLIGYEKEASA